MKKLLSLVLCSAFCFSLVSCNSSNVSSSLENDSPSADISSSVPPNEVDSDVTSDIKVNVYPAQNGRACAFITNNSDIVIQELSVQVNYYDSDGNVIDLASDGHDTILPGYTVVSSLSAPSSYDHLDVEYSTDTEIHPYYINHSCDCSLSTNQGEDCVIVKIQNNSDVTIEELEYIVVFYDGDSISHVGYCYDVYDIPSGGSVTEKESTYGFSYDRWEVYLNQAHTFDHSETIPSVPSDGIVITPAVGSVASSSSVETDLFDFSSISAEEIADNLDYGDVIYQDLEHGVCLGMTKDELSSFDLGDSEDGCYHLSVDSVDTGISVQFSQDEQVSFITLAYPSSAIVRGGISPDLTWNIEDVEKIYGKYHTDIANDCFAYGYSTATGTIIEDLSGLESDLDAFIYFVFHDDVVIGVIIQQRDDEQSRMDDVTAN